MEDLKKKYNNFKNSYESLGNVIKLQEQLSDMAQQNPVAQDLFTAGVIKHFELAYETGWKFLKQYLLEIYEVDITSPKQVFRACETYQLFPPHITNELITLADARNTTTHIYDQILAQEVCSAITKHYQTFGYILKSIQLQ